MWLGLRAGSLYKKTPGALLPAFFVCDREDYSYVVSTSMKLSTVGVPNSMAPISSLEFMTRL